jgi:hypothetical protein
MVAAIHSDTCARDGYRGQRLSDGVALTLLVSVLLLIKYEAVMTASVSNTPMPTG